MLKKFFRKNKKNIAYTTIQTMLNRLETKKIVARDTSDRIHRYYPLLKQPKATANALKRLTERFFGGSAEAVVTRLVEKDLTPEQLERIQYLIDTYRKKGGRKMNLISEITAFAISLAVNMFLIGLLICVGIAAGFRLIPNVAPRARYVISVIAFLIAVVVPLLTTLSGSSKQITLIKNVVQTEQKIPRETDFLINTNINEEFLQNKPDEATSSQSGLLENFVVLASDSLRGEIFLVLWLVISILFLIREMNGHLKLAKAQRIGNARPKRNGEKRCV